MVVITQFTNILVDSDGSDDDSDCGDVSIRLSFPESSCACDVSSYKVSSLFSNQELTPLSYPFVLTIRCLDLCSLPPPTWSRKLSRWRLKQIRARFETVMRKTWPANNYRTDTNETRCDCFKRSDRERYKILKAYYLLSYKRIGTTLCSLHSPGDQSD